MFGIPFAPRVEKPVTLDPKLSAHAPHARSPIGQHLHDIRKRDCHVRVREGDLFMDLSAAQLKALDEAPSSQAREKLLTGILRDAGFSNPSRSAKLFLNIVGENDFFKEAKKGTQIAFGLDLQTAIIQK